jgi:hypothetical protein
MVLENFLKSLNSFAEKVSSKNIFSKAAFSKAAFLNQRGNILIIASLLIVGVVFLLPLVMYIIPEMNFVVRIILVFSIIMTVRGYLGDGALTWAISGVMIYFLVIKWWWVGASISFFTLLLQMGFFGIIVWGTSKIIPHKM